jgi:hypothetical protein
MNVRFAYLGSSGFDGGTLNLAPNLSREPVAFDAALRHPLRFREAISTLHDVVISDLRFKKRDKTAYEEWKKAEASRTSTLRREAYNQAKEEILAKQNTPISGDFEKQHESLRRTYWSARQKYADYLRRHDIDLWRKLMPCDPVITVADDVVFFECFSADESSYGCLTVNRKEGFGPCENLRLGTTNVDYSWELFHHFQSLRSYHETRFRVDPAGFEVATHSDPAYREEKIDLPSNWLRGFMQIQVAMSMPMRKVTLSREAIYSVLAWLKRHKARTSPRALRFELHENAAPELVLEPWEARITAHGCTASKNEVIRIWGRQRLLSLARVLPLANSVDVYLLGTGLPSFWVVQMGEMQLTLGLSGWTTNDWTRGSALDLLAPPVAIGANDTASVAALLKTQRAATFAELQNAAGFTSELLTAALRHLTQTGQAIFDLPHQVYRWRQIMAQPLGEAEMGTPNPEAIAARDLLIRKRVIIESRLGAPVGGIVFAGKADGKPVEVLVDADGRIKRGRCLCGYHQKAGLRMGPCRHLLALRMLAMHEPGGITGAGFNIDWKGDV